MDRYRDYVKSLSEADKRAHAGDAIFPVELRIIPDCVFTTRSPLVLGVEVMRGTLKVNTPLCVFRDGICRLGRCVSIIDNKTNVVQATPGMKVAVKIEQEKNEVPRVMGKHVTTDDLVYSVITRRSIDTLKAYFRDEMGDDHVDLIVYLKHKLGVI